MKIRDCLPARCLLFLVGAAFVAYAAGYPGGALAQSKETAAANPAAEIPTVTVTSPKPPDPAQLVGDSVPKFIAAHGRPAVVTGQLARWHQGVCPVTSGLSPGFNSFVSARIEAVAAVVGAPHKDTGHCKPNVQIIFSMEPDKTIEEFAKKAPIVLGFHYPHQTKKLAAIKHTIQGWYVTATQNDDGHVGLDDATAIQQQSSSMEMDRAAQFALQSATTPGGRLGTRLATGLNSLLVHVLVVADLKKVNGYTIGSVSDYLAMLVLSQTQSPETCSPLPSILDLMASGCENPEKPEAVTAGDLAYLRALYATDLRESFSLEASDIQNAMMREFRRN